MNYLPGDGKRKKSRRSAAHTHAINSTYGGFEKIKAAVSYALDKGVTTTR